jgi:hypothetical protein
MKRKSGMRIRCEDCHVVYDIPNERFDDYTIIYRLGEYSKNSLPIPRLYCPKCLVGASC